MASPKTRKVVFADGTDGRAVLLTDRNKLTVLNWIPGAEYRERVFPNGRINEQRIMVPTKTKRPKAAYLGDWIVKTENGFQVVKFNKVENTLFFIDAFGANETPKMKQALGKWVKENS